MLDSSNYEQGWSKTMYYMLSILGWREKYDDRSHLDFVPLDKLEDARAVSRSRSHAIHKRVHLAFSSLHPTSRRQIKPHIMLTTQSELANSQVPELNIRSSSDANCKPATPSLRSHCTR